MKKLMIFLILAASILLLVPRQQTNATLSPPTEVVHKFRDWSIQWTINGYRIKSARTLIEWDYLYMEFGTYLDEFGGVENFIQVGVNSKVNIYLTPTSLTPSTSYIIAYEHPEATEMMFPMNAIQDDWQNIGEHKGFYAEVILSLKPGFSTSQRNIIESYLNTTNYFNYLVPFTFTSQNQITNVNNLTSLPLTVGSPFNPPAIVGYSRSDFGEVEWTYANNNFSFGLTYNGYYTHTLTNIEFDDTSFLDNVEKTYYYTDVDENRYLYFTYHEDDEILLSQTGYETKFWKGFTIWNLTTDEISTTNRALIYTYIQPPDSEKDVYAYLYLPELLVDDLISVSLTYKYQKVTNVLGIVTYGDWEIESRIMQKDLSVTEYPDWLTDVYIYSAVAITVGTVFTMIPATMPIGLPILISGSIAFNLANVGVINRYFYGPIDTLTKINYPSNELRTSVNQHFAYLSGQQSFTLEDPIYRIYLGNYNHTFAHSTHPVIFDTTTEGFSYTEIVWETNGTVYSFDEPYIESRTVLDLDYADTIPDETDLQGIFKTAWTAFIVPVITLAFVFILIKSNAFANPKILITVGIVFLLVLFLLGVF
jgi:hypothetical protein